MEDESRVALITGSGRRRIGQVIAWSLAEQGYSIGLHYRASSDAAQEALDSMRGRGFDCEGYCADVTSEVEVDRMVDGVLARFGRLDVLVTTASIWSPISLEETTGDQLLENIKVNTVGTFLCARSGGLAMCRQEQGGVIVTMGDWATRRPYRNHAAYFVSKGAIPTLTRTLAVELAHRNPRVRVNCIQPGPVMFPASATEEQQQKLTESTLTKNADRPESIAQAVDFFVHNQFVTGVCLPVDGGRSIFAGEEPRSG